MQYICVILLSVLGLALAALAAFAETIPNWRFLRNARRFRCRVINKQTAIHWSGSDASVFIVELLSPPEFVGKRVRATYRAWGRGLQYRLSGVREELSRFEVGREYDCWFDPQNPEQVAMTSRPSWMLTCCLGGLGLALVLFAVLTATGTIQWHYRQ